ncbi:MAG TPA: cobyrinate a,c-diamide synthase, partial [Thermodesulfovibrionales bacterium]|nr:cobyrinate a,c-diamide synthase [Thermodesulfovibrionales bacterium]
TTLALGLVGALREKGLTVVPFKKGPDYIDAGWLASAAGRPCYSLDPFLIGSDRLLYSFVYHSEGSDVSVIEGNRGLFDGMDEKGSYSTAEVAKTLRAPVILIIDCSKVTRTVAAMVLGMQRFDPEVDIRGVVLNQVAGSRHESVICKSVESYCHIPVLGSIPRLESGAFPERHMGLTPHQEHPDTERAISFAADVALRHLDIERILRIAKGAEPLSTTQRAKGKGRRAKAITESSKFKVPSSKGEVRIGVIRDSAFQFYYPENLEELQRHGSDIVEVSAFSERLPDDIDALYIGGGFPETHAIALAENIKFRDSLRNAVNAGLPVYAECGGLMYLGEGLILGGKTYPMTGIYPLHFSLEKKPQAHGYSTMEVVGKNPFFREGVNLRGHEFHYSKPFNAGEQLRNFSYAFRMKRGQGLYEKMDGICYKNVLATYTHLHAYGAAEWVEGMLRQAEAFKKTRCLIQDTLYTIHPSTGLGRQYK